MTAKLPDLLDELLPIVELTLQARLDIILKPIGVVVYNRGLRLHGLRLTETLQMEGRWYGGGRGLTIVNVLVYQRLMVCGRCRGRDA